MVFESQGILDSISAYYYSVMRDVFVGSLWATAIFLICYRYKLCDDIAGDVAGVCAIGVSLCPIAPVVGATEQQVMFGVLHLLFATCFFITLAFFAIVLFRKTDKKPTHRKRQRNMVYLFCGITIIACVVLSGIIVLFLPANQRLQSLHPVLWLESLAIFAFGAAWLVKGETILKDEKGSVLTSKNRETIPAR
jgi:amino acid transporter